MAQEMYRQGDLLFVKIDKLPKRLRKIKENIILRGEATGHAHKLVGGILYRTYSWSNPEMFIEIPSSGKIVHEEHAPLVLPKGIYQVIRQREYDPDAKDGLQFVND